MGWNCLAYRSYWLGDHFLLVARSDDTTGSRNIKPEVVFKVQEMAWYALFCFIMSPFKGEVPVFARLWPSIGLGKGSFYDWGSTVSHPSNSWASCWEWIECPSCYSTNSIKFCTILEVEALSPTRDKPLVLISLILSLMHFQTPNRKGHYFLYVSCPVPISCYEQHSIKYCVTFVSRSIKSSAHWLAPWCCVAIH